MSEVTLKINNRGYSLACDPGQEGRIEELGRYVDGRLQDISAAGAATNESHLLVLTSLVLADEVFELKDEMDKMKRYIDQHDFSSPRGLVGNISEQDEKLIAESIEYLAGRIESIAGRLAKAEQTVESAAKEKDAA